jgi:hypothetical protein
VHTRVISSVLVAKPGGAIAAPEEERDFSDTSDEYDAPASHPRTARSAEEIIRRYQGSEDDSA